MVTYYVWPQPHLIIQIKLYKNQIRTTGISYQLKRPVSELIVERLPATIELVVVSALIALISGTLLGVYTGINRKGFLSDIILAVSLLGLLILLVLLVLLVLGVE